MKAKQMCEICGHFKVVGFTDCGLICEQCFNQEVMINAFNNGVEKSAQRVEENKNHGVVESYKSVEEIAITVRQLKMKGHLKNDK